ncbi:helix-turn-helix domain-containing protein [Paenibacillus alkalitolerans]|uniref:helix-turn-helix domain-containing protein n=1 Tax=Paenibacillus alkalitolerans TaxID=2799335 RepID=UPI0018F27DCA|nr:helix-turn-helix transcriptional regulator [Paenibacillus alkalitolerans]
MSHIGAFLKGLRKERRLTLREAANRSGLSHSYINSIEQGKHPKTKAPISPSPDSLKALAKAYDYPYEDLLKEAGVINEEIREQLISEKKKEAIEIIRQLPEEDIDFIKRFLESYSNIEK